jgi:8-hydroxy-5-deazaflavin:NADPH oxidoreductase
MKTAIIGLGNFGSILARNLTAGGESVILADRGLPKAQKLAGELGAKATAMPIADAVGKADVIILAIYFDAIKGFLSQYRAVLAGKVLVDPSNPIAPDGNGGFKKTIAADQSSGELLSGLIPGRRVRESLRHPGSSVARICVQPETGAGGAVFRKRLS